jgi:hypothetical protein
MSSWVLFKRWRHYLYCMCQWLLFGSWFECMYAMYCRFLLYINDDHILSGRQIFFRSSNRVHQLRSWFLRQFDWRGYLLSLRFWFLDLGGGVFSVYQMRRWQFLFSDSIDLMCTGQVFCFWCL